MEKKVELTTEDEQEQFIWTLWNEEMLLPWHEEKFSEQEQLLWVWWNGENPLQAVFTPENEEDERDAQRDMNLFFDYFSRMEIRQLQKTLGGLVFSHYRNKNVKKNTQIQCYPRLFFKPIEPPYDKSYARIIAQYGLEKFILSNITLKRDLKCFGSDAGRKKAKGKPIYLVFIKLNDFYIVNLLGPILW